MQIPEELHFRRQFFATPAPVTEFPHWRRARVGALHVAAHPEVDLDAVGNGRLELALVGFALDPERPAANNLDLLHDILAHAQTCADVVRRARDLAGRWVLVAAEPERSIVLNDACGLRQLHYRIAADGPYLASNPALLGRLLPLQPEPSLEAYLSSNYRQTKLEYWQPSGLSFFRDVRHLVPNHYVDLTSGAQARFWPDRPLGEIPLREGVARAATLIRELVTAGASRFPLSLPITAGRDSRILMAACRDRISDVHAYTLVYRDLTERSPDVAVPAAMLAASGVGHHLIDCTGLAPEEFLEVYRQNVDVPHDEWGHIAYGILQGHPRDRVCLKGNCIEVARNLLFSDIAEDPTPRSIARWHFGGDEMPFMAEALERWFEGARPASAMSGIPILDLAYWEHFMGSWQSRSQLEWDIAQEAYTPYNHRPLLELLLSVPWRYRKPPRNTLWREIVRELWPELDRWPINPKPIGRRLNLAAREVLAAMGLLGLLRSAYRRGRAALRG